MVLQSASNTLSVFSINPNDPTNVQMIGKPVGSGGEFPLSVAINNAGNTVCALNGGAVNGVGYFMSPTILHSDYASDIQMQKIGASMLIRLEV